MVVIHRWKASSSRSHSPVPSCRSRRQASRASWGFPAPKKSRTCWRRSLNWILVVISSVSPTLSAILAIVPSRLWLKAVWLARERRSVSKVLSDSARGGGGGGRGGAGGGAGGAGAGGGRGARRRGGARGRGRAI